MKYIEMRPPSRHWLPAANAPRVVMGAVVVGLICVWLFPHLERTVLCGRLKRAIAKSADSGGQDRIRIRDITWFDWDRLYVFGPYVSEDEIRKSIGFEWSGAQAAAHELGNDGHSLLIFARGTSVILDLLFPRREGDFDGADGHELTKETAVFAARRERLDADDRSWIFVRPVAP